MEEAAAWAPPCPHSVDHMFDLEEALSLAVNLFLGDDQRHNHPTTPTSAPAVELPEAAAEDVDEAAVCSICREGFRAEEDGGGKRAPCGHVYHSGCISTWLSRCNSCPLCRARVVINFAPLSR